MKNSKGKSGECEIAGGGAFANGCFSIYWSSATKNYGWGFDGMYTQNAQARAAKACRQKSQSGCKEIRTFCTTRFY